MQKKYLTATGRIEQFIQHPVAGACCSAQQWATHIYACAYIEFSDDKSTHLVNVDLTSCPRTYVRVSYILYNAFTYSIRSITFKLSSMHATELVLINVVQKWFFTAVLQCLLSSRPNTTGERLFLAAAYITRPR